MQASEFRRKLTASPPAEFKRVQSLIREHTSIVISDAKQEFVRARIMRRIRELELNSISDYCDLIENGSEPLADFTSLITTNHTHFFREKHHFDILLEYFSSHEIKDKTLWSAGCSTGEEPYSIAISLLQKYPDLLDSGFRLIATDLDEKVIEIARDGIYPLERIEPLSQSQRTQSCVRGVGKQAGQVRIKKPIRDFIEFGVLNLDRTLLFDHTIDVIFCRNVVIYFDYQTKVKLFANFADIQKRGDLLFIGHSESLNDITDAYECIGSTTYRRK
jgi:chemotaxis protein methyltransferase CheR